MATLRLGRRSNGDSGAVAVIVALCVVVLVGVSAIAVDFANAYANKRQLSVAADAAALAAAREVNKALTPGSSCNPGALQPTARSAAVAANAQNDLRSDSVVTSVTVQCTNGQALVTVNNERQVPSILGGIFGQSSYTPNRSATAQLYIPQAVSGLRPIAACKASLLAAYQPSASPPTIKPFLVNISNSTAVCGTASSGDWGFTNFLAQGTFGDFNSAGSPAFYPETCGGNSATSGGNAGCQTQWTAQGYGGPVWFPNPAVGGQTGLGGNTGLANSSAWRTALVNLVDDIILLPVSDRYAAQPGIDRINLLGVAAVRVCSVKLGSSVTQGTSSDCAGRRLPTTNPDLATWTGYKNNEGGLWVVPTNYVTSGVADPSNVCSIGNSSCDFGTRAVRLYQ
jgi:hypothetical protein